MDVTLKNIKYEIQKINYKPKTIVEDINMNFESGKINTIIGKNGSGKTTILELINLNIVPTSGTIKIGSNIFPGAKKNNIQKKISYVPQLSEEQFMYSTVEYELKSILKTTNYKIEQYDKRINDVLIMVYLDKKYLKRDPFSLSQSEKKKLVLAQALIKNPSILILDDPSLNLDNKNKKELIQLLKILKNRYNKNIIIASNDIEFIHKISDYIYIINNRKIVLEGAKYDVFKQHELLQKYKIKVPKIIEFENKALLKKNIRLGYRDEINDLLKDIYRCVR